MERTGKSALTFLIALLAVFLPAWAAAQAHQAGFHQVAKGDTYYGLSRRYQVPVDSLKRWNGESLKLGTTVRVSMLAGKKTATPAAAAKPRPSPAGKPGPRPQSSGVPKKSPAAKGVQPVNAAVSNTRSQYGGPAEFAPAKKQVQRVLVIPFDPYLYFSDADPDIARQSRIPQQNVRHIFRGRLNAFMDPKGFESINLLGPAFADSPQELERIYKSVSYNYQPITYSQYNPVPATEKSAAMTWIQRQKGKLSGLPSPEAAGNASVAKDAAKYYGARVKDPDLYRYFNENYAVDYYLFLNQFEIHTDYTNCLDRTQNDFVREFLVHYTLFDNQGRLIAGNKVKVPYVSHVNDIEKIIRDNLNKMAQRILADLPQPALTSQASTVE